MDKPQFFKLYLQRYPNRLNYFIKDAIHGEINFSQDQGWIYDLLNTPEMERLSKIMQLSLSYNNFPTATHTRFSHSLGTYEVCNRAIKELIQNQFLDPNNTTTKIQINIALAAALTHDIGHGPHSHAFESYLNFNHENFGSLIIRSPQSGVHQILVQQAKKDGLDHDYYVNQIIKIINKKNDDLQLRWVQDLISSQIDCDRLDYLLRDSYFSGLHYSRIDFLLKWLVILDAKKMKHSIDANHQNHLGFSSKAKSLIINFLNTRVEMYVDLYQNQYSVTYETIVGLLLARFKQLYLTNQKGYDYSKYAFLYDLIIPYFASEASDQFNYEKFLELTDESFNLILRSFCYASDSTLSSLANLYHGRINLSYHTLMRLTSEEIENYCTIYNQITKELPSKFDFQPVVFCERELYDQKQPIFLYNDDSQEVVLLEDLVSFVGSKAFVQSTQKNKKRTIVIVSEQFLNLIKKERK